MRNALRVPLVAVLVLLASAGIASAASFGSLDPDFGSGGVALLGSGSQLFGVAVQANGEVVAAGQSAGSVLVERLTPAGNSDGRYIGGSGFARAVAVQSDGKIVITGSSGGHMFVERLDSTGSVDTGFGNNGVAVVSPLGTAVGNAVAIQADGKIVVAGCVNAGQCLNTVPGMRIGVARLNSNGSLDTSFGSGGTEVVDLGLPAAAAEGVTVQSDGKIVLAGYEQGSPYFGFFNGLLIRLNPNGTLDAGFASSGVLSYHYPNGGDTSLSAVTLQNDGKIVAGGIDVGGPNALFLRVTSNGTLDSSFGSGGVAALSSAENLNTNPGVRIGAFGVGIAGGGRILGAGNFENTGTDVDAAAWGLTQGGSPETTFGNGATVTGPDDGYEACALAIAPDGSLVSAGDAVTSYPDSTPCSLNSSSAGFVSRRIGYGPPPPPPPPPPTGSAPAVSTGAAGGILDTSATLGGEVDPDGLQTGYHFDYGPTAAYGSSTPTASAGAGSSAVPVSATLTGLSPDTTYHYRLVASNSSGVATGSDQTLTTSAGPPPPPPALSTGGADNVTEVSATITGEVNPGALGTSNRFDYGTSTAYGSSSSSTTLAPGQSPVGLSAALTGLLPGTTYHYRLVASNDSGTADGADATFTTAPRLTSRVHGLRRFYRIATVKRKGLGVKIGCSQPCAVHVQLVIPAGTAKRLRIGKHQLILGRASASFAHPEVGKLELRLAGKEKRLLSRLTRLGVRLQVSASPSGGGPTVRTSESLTLKR